MVYAIHVKKQAYSNREKLLKLLSGCLNETKKYLSMVDDWKKCAMFIHKPENTLANGQA